MSEELTLKTAILLGAVVSGTPLEGKGGYGHFRLMTTPAQPQHFGRAHSLVHRGYLEIVETRPSKQRGKPDTHVYGATEAGVKAVEEFWRRSD